MSPENKAWDYRVSPFKLPPLTRLMLADVDAGSDTPSLVGKVLKWRSNDSETANALWTALDTLNQSLAHTILSISELYAKDAASYTLAVKALAIAEPSQVSVLLWDEILSNNITVGHKFRCCGRCIPQAP